MKAKTYKGKSLRVGGGGKFAKMVDAMQKKGLPEERASAIAAVMGRKKYGKAKFQKMATTGRRRAMKKK